ncbi:MAG: AAA family ATPase [Saccharofermentans sp.]|nr:AAA family ATPase [Saccharofermentans sp.]
MADNTNTNNEENLRINDLLYVVFKHHRAIVYLGILGLAVGILISFAYYVKGVASVEYYVTASMAVSSTNANGQFTGADAYNPNSQDIHLAEDMTESVIYVCRSDTTLNAAAEKLQLIGVKADQIRPKLTLTQYGDTQIIEMTLIWDNADEGIMILNAITEVAPDILIDTLKIGDVTIVNQPKVKPVSLSFINAKLVAICLAAGVMGCAAYYVVMFLIHPTYLHSEDVKRDHGFDILGEIPKDKEYFNTKVNSLSANEFSAIQEYFSALAHVLVYRLQDIENVCVYFTSTSPQEGKTTITANLGYALSGLGYKTLILDMDVRNPSLASKFAYSQYDDHCLNTVYRGEKSFEEAVVRIDSNLDILPTKLEDERLRFDAKMIEIISTAKGLYDFVLIDTAPIGQVSDSLSLNSAADCALYVVRQDQVWISTINESIDRLKKSGIAILGAVMNDVKSGAVSYYHSNYNQYKDSPYLNMPDKKSKKSKSKSKNIDKESMDHSVEAEIISNRKKKDEEKAAKAALELAAQADAEIVDLTNTNSMIIKESEVAVESFLATRAVSAYYNLDDIHRAVTSFEKIKDYEIGALKPSDMAGELDRLEEENVDAIMEFEKEYYAGCIKIMIGFMDEEEKFHMLAVKTIGE